jgi:CHAT domain-containing protein/TPR repeat protein
LCKVIETYYNNFVVPSCKNLEELFSQLSLIIAYSAAVWILTTLAVFANEREAFDDKEVWVLIDDKAYEKALAVSLHFANKGDHLAQWWVGKIYDDGYGVPENNIEAVKWYSMSAAQGESRAQVSLGSTYDMGDGVPEDNMEAVKWYRLAAEQGNSDGQNKLGTMYDSGEGVSRDDIEAVKWYSLASEQGDHFAQYNLATMYHYGEGVSQDLQVALALYKQAESGGVFGASLQIAMVLVDLGMYSEAESTLSKALQQEYSEDGSDVYPSGSQQYYNRLQDALASLYFNQGKKQHAFRIFSQIAERTSNEFGRSSVEYANSLQNLAITQCTIGEAYLAIENLKLSNSIYLEQIGRSSFEHANGLGNLAYCMSLLGDVSRNNEIVLLYKDSISLFDDCCPQDSVRKALFLGNLAEVLQIMGDTASAGHFFKLAYDIKVSSLGGNHSELVDISTNYAKFLLMNGESALALELMEIASKVYYDQYLRDSVFSPGIGGSVYSDEDVALVYAASLIAADTKSSNYHDELFKAIQFSRHFDQDSFITEAVLKSTNSQGMQDYISKLRDIDSELEEFLTSSKVGDFLATNRDRDAERVRYLLREKKRVNGELELHFPTYYQLTHTHFLSIDDVQELLLPTEALILLVPDHIFDKYLVFVVSQTDFKFYSTSESLGTIEALVRNIRSSTFDGTELDDLSALKFDFGSAQSLFDVLLQPAQPILEQVDSLLVVPQGAVASLPLHILIAESKWERFLPFWERLRATHWIGRSFKVTNLPAVTSLSLFRSEVDDERTNVQPFVGFGDPALKGKQGHLRGLEVVEVHDVSKVDLRKLSSLSELPETAEELKRIADYLDATPNSVFLREDATEAAVKSAALYQSNVIAFATHGLISDELNGLTEPALVMTPPRIATTFDDGLLTASEVAQLDLNADIVLLSACNTAAGNELGASGLSGLAGAFIYAGARSLLVTHWSVDSKATTKLTTGMFAAMASDPSIGRAEALQRSMLSMIEDEENPHFAHPAFWAPFSLIGDGQTMN